MRGRHIYWLIPAQFLAHFADEAYFGLPNWCTRHFEPLPADFWIPAMWFVAALTVMLGWAASTRSAGAGVRLTCAAIQMLFFSNAFFHLITTFLFGEYSPGTASGLLLLIPLSFVIWRPVLRHPEVTKRGFATALVAGFLLHKLALLNLLVDKSGW